jgi:hypothetical protein
LKIDWKLSAELEVISGKDMVHPFFSDAEMNFKFE